MVEMTREQMIDLAVRRAGRYWRWTDGHRLVMPPDYAVDEAAPIIRQEFRRIYARAKFGTLGFTP